MSLDLEDLAQVVDDQNDVATARTDYEASLAIRQRLAAADPTDAQLQQLILRAMARLAKIGGGSVGWRDVAVQYAKIKAAGQLTPNDERIHRALQAYHLAD